MPINDAVNNVYMNNMYVTGATSQASSFGNTGAVGAVANTTQATGTTGNTDNNFSQLLTGLIGSMATSSIGSIGNFSDTAGSSSSSYMDGLMSMGGSNALLGGIGDSSGNNNMMMMLLMLLLASQNNNGQNSNLLNQLTGNTNNTANNTNNTNASCPHTASGYTSYSTTSTGIPSSSWDVANPPLTNTPAQRNAATYRSVIDQFNVENNERYRVNKQGTGDTYCNIFAWDVTRAMGAEIPHFIDNTTGAPVSTGGSYTTELTANRVNDWLNTYGASYGWTKVSAQEAQQYANMGMPAVTSWKNPAGHGHMQVVSPSMDGQYNASRGVAIAQAGRQLKNYDYIDTVYGNSTLPQVEYFVHV